MGAFLYGVLLQWKLDLRNKDMLIMYYIVPLVFFAFMGGIFTSINPMAKDSLIQSMSIFAITMGAFLGSPTPLVELYGSDIKKAFKVGGIPLWTAMVNNFISAFLHLMLVSVIIFFIAPIAFNAQIPQNIAIYFFNLSIFLITTISIGSVLGLFITKASKLTMVSQMLFLPSIMLSGIMFPSDMLPIALQKVGNIFPATWGYAIMNQDIISINDLLPLFIMIIVAMILSAVLLKRLSVE